MPRSPKHRAYTVTIFESAHHVPTFAESDYWIAGSEICPDTGRHHWQCYVHYPHPRTWKTLKEAYPRAHIEPARGSPEKNRLYCKKDGRFYEHGDLPQQGARSDIAAFVAAAAAGVDDATLLADYPVAYLRYGKHLERVRAASLAPLVSAYDESVSVHAHWGPTGTGKTRAVYDKHQLAVYALLSTKPLWFDGYNPRVHSVLLVDDYRGEIPFSQFLRLIDKYRRDWPVKGGRVAGRWTTIYITSDTHPREWYPNPDPNAYAQLRRRLTEITHFPLQSD